MSLRVRIDEGIRPKSVVLNAIAAVELEAIEDKKRPQGPNQEVAVSCPGNLSAPFVRRPINDVPVRPIRVPAARGLPLRTLGVNPIRDIDAITRPYIAIRPLESFPFCLRSEPVIFIHCHSGC